MSNKKINILFLCTGNAARSQMAQGLATNIGKNSANVESAGILAAGVHPYSIKVLLEIGIDISNQYSKMVTDEMIKKADFVITLCNHADKYCPNIPANIKKLHWPMPDPVGIAGSEQEILDGFREVRDSLKEKIATLILPEE